MTSILQYIIPFIVALGLLIFVHEFGHYLVARLCGVKVLRFSIGFGKWTLAKWRSGRDRTEWVLAAIPLGGYVKMLDEREGSVPPQEAHRAFNRKNVWQRIAIVAAGPLANLILAVFVYTIMFASGSEQLRPRIEVSADSAAAAAGLRSGQSIDAVDGEAVQSFAELRWALLRQALEKQKPALRVRNADGSAHDVQMDFSSLDLNDSNTDLLQRAGLSPWQPPIAAVADAVLADSPADHAGIEKGDRFIRLDDLAVENWQALVRYVRGRAGEPVVVEIERNGQRRQMTLTPVASREQPDIGRIGVSIELPPGLRDEIIHIVRYDLFTSFNKAAVKTWQTSTLTLKMIGRILTGEVSWKNISGPITIADYAGKSAQMGWSAYLGFIALISISLGVLNLLPIPVLDGGHLLYYAVEIIKGAPPSERFLAIGQQVGLALLAMLMLFAFFNDLSRLFSS